MNVRTRLSPVVLASLFATAACAVAAFSTTFIEIDFFVVLLSLCELFYVVTSQTIITLVSEAGTRGTNQGYFSFAGSGGIVAASFLGPLSFQLLAPRQNLAWLILAGVALLAALGFRYLQPGFQRDHERPEAEPRPLP
jgi:MFS family permease